LEIGSVKTFVARERNKRTVYGELWLGQFIASLSGQFSELAYQGAWNDLSVATVASYGEEVGYLQKQLMEDGMKRVKLMENGTCQQ
jgi:hypothetical protein